MEVLEKRDLYDINKNLTGETIYKGEVIPPNRYITVVLCFIRNSNGEFLIQKRSLNKNGQYGSTGGHPKSGESSIKGMISEIKEEIGLTVNENELELIYSGRQDTDQVFFDIYFLNKDFEISDLVLQKEEVDFVEWDSLDKIKQLIEDGLFMETHAEEVFRMIDIFKKRGFSLV